MRRLPLSPAIVNREARARNIEHLRRSGVVLPRFFELANPDSIPWAIREQLRFVDPELAHPLNLFRIHWFNDERTVPAHTVLPSELTGVDAKIVVLFGNTFPMIRAHKVLAAYACLAPRIASGELDLTQHRAVWPSTGNYCRGGVAVSRIVGCRGVAVLPEGMSLERFQWLERWVTDPSDIVRTPGTESNVKEIYDACHVLACDPANVVFNQFAEYANYLVHYLCTGRAIARTFESLGSHLKLRAFVSATGSAGTLAAGDALKALYGSMTVAVEALECPTLLENGFGEHNIQGIGDKHVPLIHNVMGTDVVTAVSDHATDALNVLFNTDGGHEYLSRRRKVILDFSGFGLSSIANILGAIKVAKHFRMGPDDVIATVATDGAVMYRSEAAKTVAERFRGRFDAFDAAATYGQYLLGCTDDNLRELTFRERERIFNLGYFTWVEQQGVPLEDFTARRDPEFWRNLQDVLPLWDAMIEEVNEEAAVAAV